MVGDEEVAVCADMFAKEAEFAMLPSGVVSNDPRGGL